MTATDELKTAEEVQAAMNKGRRVDGDWGNGWTPIAGFRSLDDIQVSLDKGDKYRAALRMGMNSVQMATLRDLLVCCLSWVPQACVMGNVRAGDAAAALDAAIAALTAAGAGGDVVAEVYAGAFGIHYIGCADPNKLPVGTKLYTRPAPDGDAVAEVIENRVGVELVWSKPPSAGRPPVGTKLYAAPSVMAPAGVDAEPLTDTFVQRVPDKCDRIIWRGAYFHLPKSMAGNVEQAADDPTLPYESALSSLIDVLVPGLDSGDILADARAALLAAGMGDARDGVRAVSFDSILAEQTPEVRAAVEARFQELLAAAQPGSRQE